MRILCFALPLALVAACSQEPPPSAELAVSPDLIGWLDTDAPGETAVVYRERAGGPDLVLSCATSSNLLRVVAPNPRQGPPKRDEKATLYLGGTSFETTTRGSPRGEPPTVTMELELTPQVLDALRRARTLRLDYREDVTSVAADAGAPLARLADSCAAITGIGRPAG